MPRTWFKGQSPDIAQPSAKKDLSKGEPRSPKSKNRKPVTTSDIKVKRKSSKHERRPSRERSKKSLSDTEKSGDSSKVKLVKKFPRPIPAYQAAGTVKRRIEGAKGRAEGPKNRIETSKGRAETQKRRAETPKGRVETPKGRVESAKVRAEAQKPRVEPRGRILTPKVRPEIAGRVEIAKDNPASVKKTDFQKSRAESIKSTAEAIKNRAEAFKNGAELLKPKKEYAKPRPDVTKGRVTDAQSRPESTNKRADALKARLDAARGREVYQALVRSSRRAHKTEPKPDVAAEAAQPKKRRLFGVQSRVTKDDVPQTTVQIKRGRNKKTVVEPPEAINSPKKSRSRVKQLLKRQIWRISKPRLKNSDRWSKLFKDNKIDIDKVNIDAVDLTLIDVEGLGIENKMMKRTVTWLLK